MAAQGFRFATDYTLNCNALDREIGKTLYFYGIPVVYRKGITGKIDGIQLKGAGTIVLKDLVPADMTDMFKQDDAVKFGDAEFLVAADADAVGGACTISVDHQLGATIADNTPLQHTPVLVSDGTLKVSENDDAGGDKSMAAVAALEAAGLGWQYPPPV